MIQAGLFLIPGVSQMNNAKVDFPQWLQQEMKRRGWNQTRLAERSGLTQGGISNLIRGTRKPGLDACRQLAAGLEIPFGDVLRAAGYEETPIEDSELATAKLSEIIPELSKERRELLVEFAIMLLKQERSQ
jgi:transcriptional regulator with XRE-family HTH domain